MGTKHLLGRADVNDVFQSENRHCGRAYTAATIEMRIAGFAIQAARLLFGNEGDVTHRGSALRLPQVSRIASPIMVRGRVRVRQPAGIARTGNRQNFSLMSRSGAASPVRTTMGLRLAPTKSVQSSAPIASTMSEGADAPCGQCRPGWWRSRLGCRCP